MKLNEYQEQAVRHGNGPALIVAGPGSGKTAVITSRISYLIEKRHVPGDRILAVTFSRKAADNMKARFLSGYHGKACPYFGTFHSIFLMILRRSYPFQKKTIITEDKKHELISRILSLQCPEVEADDEFTETLLHEISKVKSGMVPAESFHSDILSPAQFRRVYASYAGTLSAQKLIDFDDMLSLCYSLLKERPDICAYWQDRFRFILVDEFQDINRIQYECLRLLAAPENNLLVVGDDDQSIYAFRGSSAKIMKEFLKDYPEAARITLRINYRCGRVILRSAQRVIRENTGRFVKQMESGRNTAKGLFQIRKCPDQQQEYEAIAADIGRLLSAGTQPGEIAILMRRSLEFSVLQRILKRYGIEVNCSSDPDDKEDGIRLLTMHASKGLEFQYVYIPDANEGILPSKKTKTKSALEEERRVFYVAMTRASLALKIYFTDTIRQKKAAPSCFLDCFLKPQH